MDLNNQTIIGSVGKDPEIRTTSTGSIAKLSVATNSMHKGEKITTWHKVTAFNRLADICKQYISKGSKVFVTGRVQSSSYLKEGELQETISNEIIASDIIFFSKPANDNPAGF